MNEEISDNFEDQSDDDEDMEDIEEYFQNNKQ